jgi:type II restriction/modification system DNA methylase subunit YeeA
MWIIDFGTDMSIEDAALYEAPFEYVKREVMPTRIENRRQAYADRWWLHVEPRSGMRVALAGLPRFIATPTVSKYRLFTWVQGTTLPDHQLIVFARDDDYFFGVLHSSVHELWALNLGTQLETRPRYTPIPNGTEEARGEIAEAARNLDALRNGWLNPPGMAQADLSRRTLTNLYNQRPSWLDQAHERLDRAVHAAYGWDYPLERDEILRRLVELNLGRAADEEPAVAVGHA